MTAKTKVLFVDDEANVLSGLRRMLRGQRKVWEMQFANGGAAALDLMETESFDVVVSDMRMPGIDGAELLGRVSDLYPHTVRLVLSGQSEHEKIMRAVGPAHQFLSKPCEPDVLVSTIERACELRAQLDDPAVKGLTSQINSLPSLPCVYKELLAELNSHEPSIETVGEIISADLAMTAKVLQLVNSSFFGLPQHVTCPQHAVTLLGINVIQPLVLTANAFAAFKEPELECYSLRASLDHGLAVATTAKAIAEAEASDSQLVDDAFIAGMIHDLGKLVLAANLPERYCQAVTRAQAESISVSDAERDEFGTTHAEVGAHLLGLWGFPNPIVEAVAFHHQPSAAKGTDFSPLTAVHVANVIHSHRLPDEARVDRPSPDREYLQSLSLKTDFETWDELVAEAAG